MTPETTFTAAAVCAAADIPATTLRAWRARGLLTVEDPSDGGWTRYTLFDLLKAVTLAELARYGIPPGHVARLVDHIPAEIFDSRAEYEANPKRAAFILVTKAGPREDNWAVIGGWTASRLADRLERGLGKSDADTIAIVVNTAKLWRRTARVIAEFQPEGE